jgi:hypothetical protein
MSFLSDNGFNGLDGFLSTTRISFDYEFHELYEYNVDLFVKFV